MAADYDLPAVVEKRVRFFDGQFLLDQDLIDEQKYHLDRERRHVRLFHLAGIAEGLQVSAAGPNAVTVTAGTAIDDKGRQLALAADTTVDLPADRFNGRGDISLRLAYQELAEDPQAVEGSEDFTRWLERPSLTALRPEDADPSTSTPISLATLALDDAGRVTVDVGVRRYSGLRLPDPGGEGVSLRAEGGRVALSAPLSVDAGGAGAGDGLAVGGFQARDRYLTFRVDGGNRFRSGLRMWAWREAYGFSLGFDERHATGNGLHVRTHAEDAEGVSRLFVGWDGDVGVGTTDPGARLHVNGAGGANVDLLVNGRLRSDSADGGLWVSGDRFVGGHSTNQLGLFNNGAWRLSVLPDGRVGVGTTEPKQDLSVNGRLYLEHGVIQRGGSDAVTSTADLGLYSQVEGNWIRIVTARAPIRFFTDGGQGDATRLSVEADGRVGIGTNAPSGDLTIGEFQGQDRYLTLRVGGGNLQRTGVRMWAWQENHGFSMEYDERVATGNGLHVKTHYDNPDGATRLFVGWDGEVGVGTTDPGALLDVNGEIAQRGTRLLGIAGIFVYRRVWTISGDREDEVARVGSATRNPFDLPQISGGPGESFRVRLFFA